MIAPTTPAELLRRQREDGLVLLDTRSPGEFEQGRIVGAASLPLFSDEERARVGTTYKRVGRRAALLEGLEIVGPKMRALVEEAGRLSGARFGGERAPAVGVYCWRGGQRSGSVAWLLERAGFDVCRLTGGYKAYRRFARSVLDDLPHAFRVVDGATGSGKTVLLHELAARGAQVLDLEGIANHRGSAFGLAPGATQPSSEQAENEIYARLAGFDARRPVWVENESRNVGKVFLPEGVVAKLAGSPRVLLEMPREDRVRHIVDVYGDYPREHLVGVFVHLRKRLGGLATQRAIAAVDAGDLPAAVRLALVYYDKAYAHYSARQGHPSTEVVGVSYGGWGELAERLLAA